jgi:hypothetical protein
VPIDRTTDTPSGNVEALAIAFVELDCVGGDDRDE